MRILRLSAFTVILVVGMSWPAPALRPPGTTGGEAYCDSARECLARTISYVRSNAQED